jgi:hypothetical protein
MVKRQRIVWIIPKETRSVPVTISFIDGRNIERPKRSKNLTDDSPIAHHVPPATTSASPAIKAITELPHNFLVVNPQRRGPAYNKYGARTSKGKKANVAARPDNPAK